MIIGYDPDNDQLFEYNYEMKKTIKLLIFGFYPDNDSSKNVLLHK